MHADRSDLVVEEALVFDALFCSRFGCDHLWCAVHQLQHSIRSVAQGVIRE